MANMQKLGLGATAKVLEHNERTQDNGKEHSNKEIDNSRTHLNYSLCKREGGGFAYLKKRLDEVKHLNLSSRTGKNEIKTSCNWCVTLPTDVPEEREREFFERTYEFLQEKYGAENVLSAVVHKDETQPHLHFSFIPVVKDVDEDTGAITERLCAKEVVTRGKLQSFHTELSKHIESEMGQEFGVLNGKTVGGNLSIIEMKLQKAISEMAVMKAQMVTQEELNKVTSQVRTLIADVQEQFQQLDAKLKEKKWYKFDGDKAKYEQLKGNVEQLKNVTESVTNFANNLITGASAIGGKVEQIAEELRVELKKSNANIERRFKRTERNLEREKSRIIEKENNVDVIIEKKFKQKVEEKIEEVTAIDNQIEMKNNQLTRIERGIKDRLINSEYQDIIENQKQSEMYIQQQIEIVKQQNKKEVKSNGYSSIYEKSER
jgi:tetrahydromethanopterin S-methyltransferase subunit G